MPGEWSRGILFSGMQPLWEYPWARKSPYTHEHTGSTKWIQWVQKRERKPIKLAKKSEYGMGNKLEERRKWRIWSIHHKCGQPDFRGWDLGQHKTDKASIMHCPQLPEDRRSVISALRFLSHRPCLACLDGLPLKVQTRRNLCSLHFGDNNQ